MNDIITNGNYQFDESTEKKDDNLYDYYKNTINNEISELEDASIKNISDNEMNDYVNDKLNLFNVLAKYYYEQNNNNNNNNNNSNNGDKLNDIFNDNKLLEFILSVTEQYKKSTDTYKDTLFDINEDNDILDKYNKTYEIYVKGDLKYYTINLYIAATYLSTLKTNDWQLICL